MSLTPEQLAQRRAGISASDVAAIVGMHPYASPIDVWLDKTGRKEPFAGNERTKWGNILEPAIRDDYAERRGVRVEVPGTLDHPTITWAKATPDGICYLPGRGMPENGLEIKTHSFRVRDWYGEQGTDQVPAHELIQCVWNLFVSGLDVWDLVAFIDGQPADYVIRRDDDLIDMLREAAERFLVDNVKADKPPEPDGSKSYDRYLSTRFPHKGEAFVSIDGRTADLSDVRRLREVRSQLGDLELEAETIAQRLKITIGVNAGIEWTDPGDKRKSRITYRLAKDSEKTDWQAAYGDLLAKAKLVLGVDHGDEMDHERAFHDALKEISDHDIATNIKVSPGSRRFLVPKSWSKKINQED